MGDEKRKWHAHVITAHRLTESQFTELQGIKAMATPEVLDLVALVTEHIKKEILRTFLHSGLPGTVTIIPEALHFNIEIANVGEGVSL